MADSNSEFWTQAAQQLQKSMHETWVQSLRSFDEMGGKNLAPDPSSVVSQPLKFLPKKLKVLQTQYSEELTELWNQTIAGKPVLKDKRFVDPAWDTNLMAGFTASSYLVNARVMMGLADAVDADEKTRARILFGVEQWLAASSPSNFLAFNPEAQKKSY